MPSFLQKLHRRSSRPSTKHGKDDKQYPGNQTNGDHANGNGVAHRQSSSTLNSSQVGSSTPSTTPATSTTEGDMDPKTNGPTPLPVRSPTRAQRPGADPIKRYSMNVGTVGTGSGAILTPTKGLASTTSNGSHSSMNRSSLLAPRILSVTDNSWVGRIAWKACSLLTGDRCISRCSLCSARLATLLADRWTAPSRLTTIRAVFHLLAGQSTIHTSKLWCILSLDGIAYEWTLPRPRCLPPIPRCRLMLPSSTSTTYL